MKRIFYEKYENFCYSIYFLYNNSLCYSKNYAKTILTQLILHKFNIKFIYVIYVFIYMLIIYILYNFIYLTIHN